MPGINNILEIGKSSLFAHQTAINLTGQNIANVETEGYTRKIPIFTPSVTLLGDKFNLGSGVDITAIQRTRDRYIDSQLSFQNQTLSYWKTMDAKHEILEQIFEEPSSTGLGTIMNDFFNSWNELANNPENPSMRDNVIYKGDALAKKINFIENRLTNLQGEISLEMSQEIDKFNAYAEQIVEINRKLAYVNKEGGGVSNLMDERDKLLAKMDEIADITVSENDDGQVNLILNGKVFLQKAHLIKVDSSKLDNDLNHINWEDGSVSEQANGGKLGALIELREEIIPENLDKLDEFAKTMVDRVNAIHKTGYGMDGSTGINFFDEAGLDAHNIRINPQLLSNNEYLAASGDGNTGSGTNAVLLANLQDEFTMSGNTLTFTDFYANMVTAEGNRRKEATILLDGQEQFVTSLTAYQQSISGVAIDEEMTNLIKFQRGYQAAAKLITVADEMYNTIINLV
ncbi:MAG TPA: flagellar hook-associated protein FlgK [bacterium]|nr:flagellar hook-associated protein FlgK [bacterium]HPN43217.1 flagellar hook-associated protein FlgK [bacterium]